MMKLPKVTDIDVANKKILVRADLDVSLENSSDLYRLEALIPTLEYLSGKNCEIVLVGHRGRPGGKENELLSLKPVRYALENLLKEKWGKEKVDNLKMEMEENLRFDPGEEANNPEFAKKLALLGDVYVNEAFAASHREHASIAALPKLLPSAFGLRFIEEVENLSRVFESPQKPVVVVLGGEKEDKVNYLSDLALFSDKTLVAGRLPVFLDDYSEFRIDVRFEVAALIADKEDITIRSIEKFEEELANARTIVLAGPVGRFEEEGHRIGTKRVFEKAATNTQAFKVAGGGDTIAAISLLGLKDKFDWISVGGGAMLEFLTKRTLPGIEALR
jgi:3-phosphoglycerate kinase